MLTRTRLPRFYPTWETYNLLCVAYVSRDEPGSHRTSLSHDATLWPCDDRAKFHVSHNALNI